MAGVPAVAAGSTPIRWYEDDAQPAYVTIYKLKQILGESNNIVLFAIRHSAIRGIGCGTLFFLFPPGTLGDVLQ